MSLGIVLNQNKQALLQLIDQRITSIDQQCALLTHQISLYSDQTLSQLTQHTERIEKEIVELTQLKNNRRTTLMHLQHELAHLKDQHQEIQQHSKVKRKQLEYINSQQAYLEEKFKEQAPHIISYRQQKANASSNSSKIAYAKQKLNRLQQKLNKEWQEAQYQHRLNILIKHKLRQLINQASNKSSKDTPSADTAVHSAALRSTDSSQLPQSKQERTELSDFTECALLRD